MQRLGGYNTVTNRTSPPRTGEMKGTRYKPLLMKEGL